MPSASIPIVKPRGCYEEHREGIINTGKNKYGEVYKAVREDSTAFVKKQQVVEQMPDGSVRVRYVPDLPASN